MSMRDAIARQQRHASLGEHGVASEKRTTPAFQSSNCRSVLLRHLAAGLICGPLVAPLNSASAAPFVVLDSNTAILGDLKRLSKTKQRFGVQDPIQASETLSSRFLAAQQQLRRIELLVKIQQYDTARLQLREGSFQTLRMDLGYGQEMYRVVSPTVVRRVIDNLQQLDGLLKQREPQEALQPLLREMQQQLGDLADIMGSLE